MQCRIMNGPLQLNQFCKIFRNLWFIRTAEKTISPYAVNKPASSKQAVARAARSFSQWKNPLSPMDFDSVVNSECSSTVLKFNL